MRGAIGNGKGGGICEGHDIGDGHHAVRGGDRLFGQSAVIEKGQNPAAGGRAADPGTKGLDHARHFHARRIGQGGLFLILAVAHQKIGKVQRGRGHAQPQLARTGRGAVHRL